MKRIYIIVHGRVQGVAFRAGVVKAARELGLKGYAKNKNDYTVEIVAEGTEKELELLIAFCRKGPMLAKVEKVDVAFEEPKGEFDGFSVTY